MAVRQAAVDDHSSPSADVLAPIVGRRRLMQWASGPIGPLVIVGVAFAVAQILLFDESRLVEWDEAVYIGRASGKFEQPLWGVHRALGVPWLLSPIFIVSSSFVWMRWYLVLTSTIALCLGFGAWVKPIGRLAAAAMLLFCSSWLTLFYGSEASPNLYVAACVVGAIGSLTHRLDTPTLGRLAPAAIGLAFAVLLRPSDGIVAGVGFVLVGFTATANRRRLEIVGLAAGAMFVGMIPWAVDAWANFGDPWQRWGDASQLVGGGLGWRLDDHVRLLDGPLVGPDTQPGYPTLALIFLAGCFALACAGVAFARHQRAASVALGVAGLMAAPYIFYVAPLAPRFLFPAYALLSIATALGVAGIVRRWKRLGLLMIGALAGFGVLSGLQAQSFEQEEALRRYPTAEVAAHIVDLANGRPCALVSEYRWPELIVTTGCMGTGGLKDELACLAAARADAPDRVVIVGLVGWVVPEIELAIVGEPISGPDGWVVMEVDPARAACILPLDVSSDQ